MKNGINWFEIPVTDFNRAKTFYENILGCEIPVQDMKEMKMGMLPADEGGIGGALVKSQWHQPANGGTTVYLNGNPDISHILTKVEGAGGKIMMPKTDIGNNMGAYAVISDSEGNMVGLHSNN
jgi:uncharacterized protein